MMKVREVLSSAMSLLGNAATHILTERRKSLMKHLNKDLCPLGDGDFPNRGAYLFGEEFGARAKAVSDNIKALKGISLTVIF